MNKRRRHDKNRQSSQSWHADDSDGAETVDDLAYAATFAMAQTVASPTSQSDENGGLDTVKGMETDDNEIDIAADDKNENSDEETDKNLSSANNENAEDSEESRSDNPDEEEEAEEAEDAEYEDDDDDDSDDEQKRESNSKVDLVDAMKRMNDEDDNVNSSIEPAKTENEIDPYRTPLEKLEQEMNLRLRVEEKETSNFKDRLHLPLAGKIRNHLVDNRTVVVESVQGGKLLDEGSLLVLRISQSSGQHTLVPLGRILEIFGPVSQPLYTIRLAQPKSVATDKTGEEKPNSAGEQSATGKLELTSVQDDEKKTDDLVSSESLSSQPEAIEDFTPTTPSEADKPNSTDECVTASDDAQEPSKIGIMEARDTEVFHTSVSDERSDHQSIAETQSSITDTKSSPEQVSASEMPDEDPWSPNGKYTQMLSRKDDFNNLPVYFIEDESKFLDTVAIMRSSRKGCDASNLYDEEVINVNDMYFSDDEEERQAKNRQKSRGGDSGSRPNRPKHNSDRRGRGRGRGRNNHHQIPPPAFAPQNWVPQGFAPMQPQGFHNPPAMVGAYQHPSGQVYPSVQPSFGVPAPMTPLQGMPPPPPPPPQFGRQVPATRYAQGMQPPPPPPPPPQGTGGYGRHVPGMPPPNSQQQSPTNANAFYYDYS